MAVGDKGRSAGFHRARGWLLRAAVAGLILSFSSISGAFSGTEVAIAGGATGLNVAFLTAGIMGSRGQPVGGLNVLQVILGAPQTAAFNILVAINAEKGNHDSTEHHLGALLLMAPAITGTTLMTYGSLSLGEMESRDDRIGLAVATGGNLALTAGMLGCAADGRTSPPALMYAQLLITTPLLAFEISQGAAAGSEERAWWIAETVWSGGIFLHGIASMLTDQDLDFEARAPGAPRLAVLPAMISDGGEQRPGLVIDNMF